MNPPSPITGDQVTATVNAEGNPAHPTGAEAIEWHITPPTAAGYKVFGSPIDLDLNESGLWNIQLTVFYEHEYSLVGEPDLYSKTVTQEFDISSVFANFIYSPSSPLNTESIVLNANSSSVAAGASPSGLSKLRR